MFICIWMQTKQVLIKFYDSNCVQHISDLANSIFERLVEINQNVLCWQMEVCCELWLENLKTSDTHRENPNEFHIFAESRFKAFRIPLINQCKYCNFSRIIAKLELNLCRMWNVECQCPIWQWSFLSNYYLYWIMLAAQCITWGKAAVTNLHLVKDLEDALKIPFSWKFLLHSTLEWSAGHW